MCFQYKDQRLLLSTDIIAVYSEYNMNPINEYTSLQCVSVETGDTYSRLCAFLELI
jgi:hypothetical protein